MARYGIVIHRHRLDVRAVASQVVTTLVDAGAEVVMPETDAAVLQRADLGVANFAEGLDACISIGGDGTILSAVSLVAEKGVAILGINVGRMGYLAEIEPERVAEVLQRLLVSELEIESRMMVEVELPSGETYLGLNEAVVFRSDSGHSMLVGAAIDGNDFLTYSADGVILATPTGSTAYSMAAGGPVVESGFHALVLTPVTAHTVFNRAMVLPPSSEVAFTVEGYRSAEVSIDGRFIAKLEPGDRIKCTAAATEAKFLIDRPRDFHAVLKDKFGIAGA